MKIKFVMARSVAGFAIGDILGVPYEFKKRGSFSCEDMRASRFGDVYGPLPLGSWSDDTSLLLCVLDALKETEKKDIYKKWRKNAIQWLKFGKFTNHGYRLPFDAGRSCKIGIDCMLFYRQNRLADNINSNGNGGLMRILPLAFVPFADNNEILDAIKLFNSCSHNHIISHICCLVYILLAKNLLEGHPFEDALQKTVDCIEAAYRIPELERIWSGTLLDVPVDEIKSTGYVVDTLEAAVWCCKQGKDYKETVLTAVNLGGDTDTIAAIAGGLAGIMYDELPTEWVKKVRNLHVLQKACNSLGIITERKFL